MRIVSLCPSVTELIFAFGRGRDLVGITRYCTHPPDQVNSVEAVGGTKDPRVDRIIELRPDVVLLNEEENRKEDAEALIAAGIHCHVTFPRSVAESASMTRNIGRELRCEPVAEEVAREIETRRQRVRRARVGLEPVSWAYLIWRKPWMAVNAQTFIDDLLTTAGGRNVFATKPERYPEIELSDLLATAPDIVFLATEPFPFEEHHLAELSLVTGWVRDRFAIVDGRLLSWYGSCTPQGIDYAEQVIHSARESRRSVLGPSSTTTILSREALPDRAR